MASRKILINRNKPDKWNEDTKKSVRMYNDWFLNFAPATYVGERQKAMKAVANVIKQTDYLHFSVQQLKECPSIVTTLRMVTTPPLAMARLVGFAGIKPAMLKSMEEGKLPSKMSEKDVDYNIEKILNVINKLLDRELFPWLDTGIKPEDESLKIAECIVADRLCGTLSDPIIRNEQEKRQLSVINSYLTSKGYSFIDSKKVQLAEEMSKGTFTYHLNVPAKTNSIVVNMPIDVVVKRKSDAYGNFPLLIGCKSAGDFTNTNKRRKEEAQKVEQLKATYGNNVNFILFLCGYFDSGYLGYEAAEGIDWIWEHRVEDLKKAGI